MPTVLLTRYECERNLVPRLCVRCGAPADEAVRLTVLDPTTHVLVAALLQPLLPPLFVVLATILQRRRAMRLPMCPADRADWEWRDRVTSWSYVLAVCVPYVAAVGLVVVSSGTAGSRASPSPGRGISPPGHAGSPRPPANLDANRADNQGGAGGGPPVGGQPASSSPAHGRPGGRPRPGPRRAWFGDVRDDYDDGPG